MNRSHATAAALLALLVPAGLASSQPLGLGGGADGCSSSLIINEIRIDQPGADNDEYFELRGAPGQSLDGVFYLVIGDQPGATPPLQNGAIEAIVDLSGNVLDDNGLFLVAESTFTLATPDLVTTFNFENFDNVTHLLVRDFSGKLNQVLDTNQDGTLDLTPWSELLCSVAIVSVLEPDGITAEFYYSSVVVGPDNGFAPGHIWRCSNTLEWRIGPFDILKGEDTPGAENAACEGGGGGSARINEVRIDMPGGDVNEYFELFGDPGASLDGLTYIVIGDGGAAQGTGVIEFALPLDGLAINSNGYFVAAGPSFTLAVADFIIADAPASGFFENGDIVTHLLVRDFTGTVGQDLDPDNTCTLAESPWGEVVDSVSLVSTQTFPPPAGTDCPYSDVRVGPDGAFVPGHVYRCDDEGTWAIGAFDPGAGSDTPGGPNPPCENLSCGAAGTSPCTEAQANPYCSDLACCEAVCKVDPTCCEISWDAECATAAIGICFGSGKPGIAFLYADTSPTTLGSGNTATVRATGIVGPNNGINFFNVQGANSGNFANWGAIRWNLADLRTFLDAEAAAGGFSGWTIDAVSISLTQSNAAFSAAGDVTAWYSSDDATEISPSVAAGTLGGTSGAYEGQLGTVVPITTWTFTPVSTGTLDTYELPSAEVLGDLNDPKDGFVTLVLTAEDAASATYRGQNAPFTSGGNTLNAPYLRIAYTLVKGGTCPGDLNGDGGVDGADLGILLQSWGACPGKQPCPADTNGDGVVDGADLGTVLQNWGACP